MHRLLAVFALLSSACAHDFKDAYRVMKPAGDEISTEFLQTRAIAGELYYPGTPEGRQRLADLTRYTFVFVPGFMSDAAVEMDLYFRDYTDWLESLNIGHMMVDIESEASPQQNAAVVREAILAAERPVVLITHSKGGIDSLVALVEQPEIRGRVAGWIAIQSPFRGSPIADQYLSYAAFRSAYAGFLKLLGGSVASLEALTFAERLAFNREHEAQLEDVVAEIPIIALATWIDDVRWEADSPFEPYRDFMVEHLDLKNDGLVPVASASLPGMAVVTIAGVDHLSTIMRGPFVSLDRARMFQALLVMLETRMEGEAARPE